MINLNSKEFEVKNIVIFNNGNAGVVKVKSRVEKKKETDNPKSPDYKIFFIDENGGEINKGWFDNFDEASEKALAYFVKEMKHLITIYKGVPLEQAESYRQILDYTMKQVREKQETTDLLVAVSYGSVKYPSKYLSLGAFWDVTNAEDAAPRLGSDALKQKPNPDGDAGSFIATGSEDSEVSAEDGDW